MSGTMPASIPPDVVSQLLEALQNLGVSQQAMGEVRSKDSQAAQKARVVPGRARRLAELEEKKDESRKPYGNPS